MKARWDGEVLAESEQTIDVGGYHYFPRDRVWMEKLRRAAKTPHDLECPHGVPFYDVVENPARGKRLAWSYEAPEQTVQFVGHWIGFWRDVMVEP